MTGEDIVDLIGKDAWMMDLLQTARTLALPDWYIGAGFIRSVVWDSLHGYIKRTPIPDIDVIYFDKGDFSSQEAEKYSTKQETLHEQELRKLRPKINWSVTNQARMHLIHGDKPYENSEESLAQWIETATCIGARLEKDNKIILITPWGIEDLVNLVLRPTPKADPEIFKKRIEEKQWIKKWPKLKVVTS